MAAPRLHRSRHELPATLEPILLKLQLPMAMNMREEARRHQGP